MLKLFEFLKPYRLTIGMVLVLIFIQSFSELYLPTLMADIVNTGIIKGDTAYIFRVGGLMLWVAAGGMVCAVISGFYSSQIAMGFGRILRERVFGHVESFSLHEFEKVSTPSLITRTTNDITQIQMVIMIMLRMMVGAPIMAIGGIVMAISEDAKLSWIIVIVLPILALVIWLIAGKGVRLFKVLQTKLDNLNSVLREGLTGIRVIRAFNRTHHEQKRFQEANQDLTQMAIRINQMLAGLMPAMMLVLNFTTIAIIWFGGLRVDAGEMQIGDLMAFLQYVMQIMFAFLMATMMFVMIPRAQASSERINEVLAIAPEIHDPPKPQSVGSTRGYLEFKNVSFKYPGAEEAALKEISFSASPGEVTAIIGGTGSGKSTLINLIPRFYDVTEGDILIDGVDIREMPQERLRQQLGFVPQKAVLFTGTIAENIRFGKETATDEEVRKAAELAQATEFIAEMKEGFETVIAQGGTNVSGGQRQRLAIARALVRQPEIFIFDDSFSALDFKTDARLRAALREETAAATVIIVAQRVNTIIDADRIIVLDEGRIAGIGKHRDLMQNCRVYREIVSSQLAEEEIA